MDVNENYKLNDMKKLLSFGVLSGCIILIFSCSKKNEEDLSGGTTCNSTNMTYTVNIKPILQSFCFSCHGNGLSQNGVNFDTYAGVKAVVDNGKLIGVITHASGFPAMPQNASKLSDCNINKIQDWISRGALNN
jgi:cytochrome c553